VSNSGGFNQDTIHRKVAVRDQFLLFRHSQLLPEKRASHGFVEQSVTVGTEYRMIPHFLIHAQSHKPMVQQVVVNMCHQLPFGSDGKTVRRDDASGTLQNFNFPDYVSISVRAISFFPEQGVAHMSATASLGTIAARSNCCISGNQSTVDRNDSPHRFSQEVRILCIHTVFQYALR
jgi:hypothetical protein